MKKLAQILLLLVSAVFMPVYASAQETYRMTGAAQFEQGHDTHKLPFPVNPQTAAFLTFDDSAFSFHYAGHSCNVKIGKKMKFYVDPVISHSFGSRDKFNAFLSTKFHAKGAALTDTYILGDVDAPLCSGFRSAMIYRSPDKMVLLDGSWAYAFERQSHAPINAEQSFDCNKAATNVEHLICKNPDLIKLDATVNRGYVAMMLTNSKEISYQDPVRLNQINWIKTVRNSCGDNACLMKAYNDRIAYIKGRIASTYPSYPEEDSNQEGD
ncbi:lysozyme inhibitor LprI family protein [Burkholderia glumae]|uniref:lysozyme inhibitor LprI family protein n=1 Tax=Burkholderia glumae TaxID=337 RepID=UPI003B9F8777